MAYTFHVVRQETTTGFLCATDKFLKSKRIELRITVLPFMAEALVITEEAARNYISMYNSRVNSRFHIEYIKPDWKETEIINQVSRLLDI